MDNTELAVAILVGAFALAGTVIGAVLGWIPSIGKWLVDGLRKRRGILLRGMSGRHTDYKYFFFVVRLVNLDQDSITISEIGAVIQWYSEPEGSVVHHHAGTGLMRAEIYDDLKIAERVLRLRDDELSLLRRPDLLDCASGKRIDAGAEVYIYGVVTIGTDVYELTDLPKDPALRAMIPPFPIIEVKVNCLERIRKLGRRRISDETSVFQY